MQLSRNHWARLALATCLLLAGSELTGQLEPMTGLRLTPDASARVGRPLTPVSVAGVARRTTRRTVRRSAIYMAALPPGCPQVQVDGTPYWYCGGTYYQQSGAQYVVVYIDD